MIYKCWRPLGARVRSLPRPLNVGIFICLLFNSLQAKNAVYFPVDSSDVYVYAQHNRVIGATQSSYTSYITISKYKQVNDSTISRTISIDSSGSLKAINDTCYETFSSMICNSEALHLPTDTSAKQPNRFFASIMSQSYWVFDSSSISGGPTGGGKREYYQSGIGLIYSFRNWLYGIGESQIERRLISKNSVPFDYQSVIDSLRSFRLAGAFHVPKSIRGRQSYGTLDPKINALGRRSTSSFLERIRSFE